MLTTCLKKESIDYLRSLSKNNNRDWFNTHKNDYVKAYGNVVEFADALLAELRKHDNIETTSGKQSLHRIYKDVRFSKDKTPYNTHWSGGFRRATARLRGGYYYQIGPVDSFVACGFWGPNADDLKRIRQDIIMNYADWNALLAEKTLVKTFGKMMGQQLTSAPRGFEKDHPAIELLRYKQFLLKHSFTPYEVASPNFLKTMNDTFKKMRPFLDFMSEVLTTDANGQSIIESNL